MAVDGTGSVYVSDYHNSRSRKINSDGTVTTLAGTAVRGSLDGSAQDACFDRPFGIAVDGGLRIYVVASYNDALRVLD